MNRCYFTLRLTEIIFIFSSFSSYLWKNAEVVLQKRKFTITLRIISSPQTILNADKCMLLKWESAKRNFMEQRSIESVCIIHKSCVCICVCVLELVDGILHKKGKQSLNWLSRLTWKCINYNLMIQTEQTLLQQQQQQYQRY